VGLSLELRSPQLPSQSSQSRGLGRGLWLYRAVYFEEIVRRGGCSYDNNEPTTQATNHLPNVVKYTLRKSEKVCAII